MPGERVDGRRLSSQLQGTRHNNRSDLDHLILGRSAAAASAMAENVRSIFTAEIINREEQRRQPASREGGAAATKKRAPAAERIILRSRHAQEQRSPKNSPDWVRSDRHRAGLRVRLFRRAGLQGPARGRLRSRARELESGHDHDRSGVRGSHLHRADHARGGRSDPRARKAGRPSADDGRPDRAERRDGAEPQRRSGAA